MITPHLNSHPYDDVIPCLNSLQGFKLGIISNGDLKQQMFKLEKINGHEVFDTIITAGEA